MKVFGEGKRKMELSCAGIKSWWCGDPLEEREGGPGIILASETCQKDPCRGLSPP